MLRSNLTRIVVLFALVGSLFASDAMAQKRGAKKPAPARTTAPSTAAPANPELAAIDRQIASINTQLKKAKGSKKTELQAQLEDLRAQRSQLLASGGSAKKKEAAKPDPEIIKYYPYDSIDYQVKSGYNPLSVIPVHISDVMHRLKMVRRLDFNEKCNTPFLNRGSEFFNFLVTAYKAGQLEAFADDSLNKVKNPKFVMKFLKRYEMDDNGKVIDSSDISFRDLNICDIREDLIFDRQLSQTKYDIQSVGLILPASQSEKGATEPICYFRYKDVEKVLNANPRARWRNAYNNVEDRRFSDAFRLRLFCSRIMKLSKDNPENEEISALPKYAATGVKGWLLASQQLEHDLVSFENELYEY